MYSKDRHLRNDLSVSNTDSVFRVVLFLTAAALGAGWGLVLGALFAFTV